MEPFIGFKRFFIETSLLFLYPISLFYPWKNHSIEVFVKRNGKKEKKKIKVRIADNFLERIIGFMFSKKSKRAYPIMFKCPCCLWMTNVDFNLYIYGIRNNELFFVKQLFAHDINKHCFKNFDFIVESPYKLF